MLIVVGFGAAGVALVGLVGYRADRLAHFLNPCADALGSGFQNCQALYAFGSGGIFGVGLGNSVQKYEWLPEAHTDFIFAIIGEELGLIGTVAVLGGVSLPGVARSARLAAGARPVRRAARGRHHFVDLHAGVHQRDGGDRCHPHNGHPAALHQLRWHLAGDHPRGHGHPAQHLRPGSTARDDESCVR